MNEIDPTSLVPGASLKQDAAPEQPQPQASKTAVVPEHSSGDTVAIAALFPNRSVRLVVDPATQIVQAQVRDAAGRVLREFPEESWLKMVKVLREYASQAIVDKKA